MKIDDNQTKIRMISRFHDRVRSLTILLCFVLYGIIIISFINFGSSSDLSPHMRHESHLNFRSMDHELFLET